MNLLFIGDIIGKPGRKLVQELLPAIKERFLVNLTVANVENAAGGFGLTLLIADELLKSGIDVMTSGNHIWDKKEILEWIPKKPQVLRPANFPPGCPGAGLFYAEYEEGRFVAILNLQGRVYLPPIDCPFRAVDSLLSEVQKRTSLIMIDFHAEATSEKICLGRYVDGRVSALLGTHTHVQTADEQILPQGTAFITDVGMTGPQNSVIGVEYESSLQRFLYQIPRKYENASGSAVLHAVLVEIDDATGRANGIQRLALKEDWKTKV